jgi:MFS transporter, ACS family, tartrate transporter
VPAVETPAVLSDGLAAPALPDAVEAGTMRKVAWRILPLITVCYLINQIDRVNVAFAALTMNADLHLTPEAYGFGAGLFFLGYIIFQLPSNLVLAKAGARVAVFWIMLAWGVVAMGMALISSPTGFAVMRFLLGLAEGGFLPGMILYLTHWFPAKYRAHTLGLFITAAPLSSAISGPLSNLFLSMNGIGGLHGWQWLFLGEGIPAIVLAFVVLGMMTDYPRAATWLTMAEQRWLDGKLDAERRAVARQGSFSFWYAFRSPRVLLLAVIYAVLGPGIYGVVLWLPQMLKSTGLDNMQIGLLSIIPYASGALGMVLWCRRSDRQGERRLHTAIPGFVAALGLMAGAYAGGVLGNPLLALAALTVAMIGVWAMIGVFWTLPSQFVTGMAAAAGIAVVNCCGAMGSFAGPYLVGWIRGATGSFTLALLALASCALLAALLALLIPAELGRAELAPAGTRNSV